MRFQKFIGPTLVLLVVQTSSLIAFGASDTDLAVQFFPADMKASLLKNKPEGTVNLAKYVTTARGDLNGSGKANFLVCIYTYTENEEGALRVIRTDGPAPVLAAEGARDQLDGLFPGIKLVDLDRDKKPEIVIDMMVGRGYENTWIYRWTGSKIQMLNPISKGRVESLGPLEFLDLTGDGRLTAIEQQPTLSVIGEDGMGMAVPIRTYAPGSSGLTLRDVIVYKDTFELTSNYLAVEDSFSSTDRTESPILNMFDPKKSYVLKVIDMNMSKPDLGPLLTSVEVYLNGKRVVGPRAIKPGVRKKVISVPVKLRTTNDYTVKIKGATGSKMLLIFSETK